MSESAPESELIDGFGRRITYLRLSVIEQCNYHCFYCRPDTPACHSRREILTPAELAQLAAVFTALGVRAIRLTGGEPLLRKDIVDIAQHLRPLVGLEELSLSTNGHGLKAQARALAAAGVRRVNISLDTLSRERFAHITGIDDLAEVMAGIEAARAAGLAPIKVNMVVMRGINDDEIIDMVRFAEAQGIELRFIETMPIGEAGVSTMERHVPVAEILERIHQAFGAELIVDSTRHGSGPASYYQIGNQGASIGVIGAVSRHFCETCNRVRLNATGELVTCLGREGASNEQLQAAVLEAIARKPKAHDFHVGGAISARQMSGIGG